MMTTRTSWMTFCLGQERARPCPSSAEETVEGTREETPRAPQLYPARTFWRKSWVLLRGMTIRPYQSISPFICCAIWWKWRGSRIKGNRQNWTANIWTKSGSKKAFSNRKISSTQSQTSVCFLEVFVKALNCSTGKEIWLNCPQCNGEWGKRNRVENRITITQECKRIAWFVHVCCKCDNPPL